MTQRQDEIIRQRLASIAPAARDPLFRILLAERRERRRFRARLVSIGLLTIVVFAVALAGLGSTDAGSVESAFLLLSALLISVASWKGPAAVREVRRSWLPRR